MDWGYVSRAPLPPTQFGPLTVNTWTHIGKRPNQEDRYVVAPGLCNGEYAFFGVFDGTVKEFAAEFVHRAVLDCLVASESFKALCALDAKSKGSVEGQQLMAQATTETYLKTDELFLGWARANENHYSSCTGVTALIHLPSRIMAVGHIGDSRLILGTEENGKISGRSLTIDHKPNDEKELARIESCGGSLTYLHGGKPFIRGGDFGKRKHAMQLNYSRAFGGKDLKMYGLSAEPTVSLIQLNESHRSIVLGSDGIWDVIEPNTCVNLAQEVLANKDERSPAEQLCTLALQLHVQRKTADNVTAVCVYFDFKPKP